jgi:hypothetical protein
VGSSIFNCVERKIHFPLADLGGTAALRVGDPGELHLAGPMERNVLSVRGMLKLLTVCGCV